MKSRTLAGIDIGTNTFRLLIAEVNGDSACIETRQGLTVWVRQRTRIGPNEEISVAVRPEKIQILSGENNDQSEIVNRYTGKIEEIVYVGEARIYRISLAPEVIINAKVQSGPDVQKYDIGDSIVVGWRTRHGLALK